MSERANCWCGAPGVWVQYGTDRNATYLCNEHKPQLEIREIRPAQFGPAKKEETET